ncbi:hypothetical protein MFIFM68171_08146 [Madurella fahalii]|uniref:Uncharacterized protein n=1 Tax=Madurella fahalii TaxID=1157608 RepID=A0ABQ0GJM2_9PEZI
MVLGMIGVIIGLLVRSQRANGFTTIDGYLTVLGFNALHLLWTTLPTGAFTLLNIFWGEIVSSTSERQPFIDLAAPHGGTARQTVALSYRTQFIACRIRLAFKNHHWVVGLVELGKLLSSVLPPLSSSLFLAKPALFAQQASVLFNRTFDLAAMSASMDSRAIIDTATAMLLYGAGQVPWTDREYAFRPFYPVNLTSEMRINSTSLTARTIGHSAELDCSVLDPNKDYQVSARSQTSPPNVVVDLRFTAIDQGCPWQQDMTVIQGEGAYLSTSTITTCGAAAQHGRLVFIYGSFSESSPPTFLANTSVVSCIVKYQSTEGDLTISVLQSLEGTPGTGAGWRVQQFRPTSPARDARDDWRGSWPLFERKLFSSQSFSSQTAWKTSDFGALVLYRAIQRQNGDGYGSASSTDTSLVVDGDVLADSISDVFSSVYTMAMATGGLVGLGNGRTEIQTGFLGRELTRLFVVNWVAYVIFAILGAVLALTVLVYGHVHARHGRTYLAEEPATLESFARLLSESELAKEVKSKEQVTDGSRWRMDPIKYFTVVKFVSEPEAI